MHVEEKGSTKPKIRLKKRSAPVKTESGEPSTEIPLRYVAPVSECGNNPLNRLCVKLLDWDINNPSLNQGRPLPSVPMTFENYRSYVNTWEPLLVEEMRANILSTCPPSTFKQDTSICSIQMPSDLETKLTSLLTVQGSMSMSGLTGRGPAFMDILLLTERINPHNKYKAKPPGSLPNGFVNISKSRPASATSIPPSADSNGQQSFLAIVNSQTWTNEITLTLHRQRVLKSQKDKDTSKLSVAEYTCKVLCGLTSSWREFLSLHEAHRMPLLPYLLNPSASSSTATATSSALSTHPPPPPPPAALASKKTETMPQQPWRMDGVGEAFNTYIQSNFNSSQRRAVSCAVERSRGFSLIQGPPGTGKTTTILGMLNALHVRDYNCYFDSLVAMALGTEGLQCRRQSAEKNLAHGASAAAVRELTGWSDLVNGLSSKGIKPHLLVVAPSNVAVNNIIEKIMEKGFKDSSGATYFPNILRIGSSRSKEKGHTGESSGQGMSAESVSLEGSVDTLLREEIDESILSLKKTLQGNVKEISHLQTILLNLKHFFAQHKLNRGWELRISPDNAQPYWVDHQNSCTSPHPPPFNPSEGSAFSSAADLPEYHQFALRFVYILEQFRVNSLRSARVKAIIQHRAKFGTRQMGTLRQTLEASFIEEADIVFSTLNSAGHPCLEGSCFPVVICDEAAQCVEPSTLIPLRHGAVQCVMVGDHKQLSATTFSKQAAQNGFDISLFERIQSAADEELFHSKKKCVDGAVMLNTQYRMLPEICRFPSKAFYHDELSDGDNVRAPFYSPSFIASGGGNTSTCLLKPFLFFDLVLSREHLVKSSSSYANKQEALLCVNLVRLIASESRRMHCEVGTIGIITPYQEQLTELRSCFRHSRNAADSAPPSMGVKEEGEIEEISMPSHTVDFSELNIEMNTVDAFQGREKDVIIFSCVRANKEGNIGFLSDKRRMNVALTRARFGMYVVGHSDTLQRSNVWNNLLLHSSESNSVVTVQTASDDLRQCARNAVVGTASSGVLESSPVSMNVSLTTPYSSDEEQARLFKKPRSEE